MELLTLRLEKVRELYYEGQINKEEFESDTNKIKREIEAKFLSLFLFYCRYIKNRLIKLVKV